MPYAIIIVVWVIQVITPSSIQQSFSIERIKHTVQTGFLYPTIFAPTVEQKEMIPKLDTSISI